MDVPVSKITSSCSWPAKKHRDQFCTKRSDSDIFLTDGSEYSPTVEYDESFIDTRIDFVETFPNDYNGTPNMTITQDGREVFPGYVTNNEEQIVEYSPVDETFNPGNQVAPSQNQNSLAVAQIFQEVESPNLQNAQNSRIEEEKAFYPQNAESENGFLKDFVDPFPDFTPNFDREAGHEDFTNFGQKLTHNNGELRSTSLILSELDATAFDRSDEMVDDTADLVSTGGKMKEGVQHNKVTGETSRSAFKQDFESSFNPGFSNFGNFEGDPNVTWMWGTKTEK